MEVLSYEPGAVVSGILGTMAVDPRAAITNDLLCPCFVNETFVVQYSIAEEEWDRPAAKRFDPAIFDSFYGDGRLSMSCRLEKGSNVTSPFDRLVIVEWHDGPVSGVAACSECSEEYAFKMLAWDREQRSRIFALAAAPPGSVAALVRIFAKAGEPKWPVWWPAMFPTEVDRSNAWVKAQEVLDRTGEAQYLLESSDLSTRLASTLSVMQADRTAAYSKFARMEHSFDEWRSFLEGYHA